MSRKPFENMNCPIAQTANIVGERWSILILRNAFCGMKHFQDFQQHLGIATSSLTARLQQLTENGILKRVPCEHDGRSYEYQLTTKGLDLYPLLLAMTEWGETWAKNSHGRRIRIIERATGQDIGGVTALSPSRQHPLWLADLDVKPGPGADEDTRRLFELSRNADPLIKESESD